MLMMRRRRFSAPSCIKLKEKPDMFAYPGALPQATPAWTGYVEEMTDPYLDPCPQRPPGCRHSDVSMAGLLARGSVPATAFPVLPSGIMAQAIRLQLRGQPRLRPRSGHPHRVPFESPGLHPSGNHQWRVIGICLWSSTVLDERLQRILHLAGRQPSTSFRNPFSCRPSRLSAIEHYHFRPRFAA